MTRATAVLAATSIAGAACSIWLYLDNRSLRADRDDARATEPHATQAQPTGDAQKQLDARRRPPVIAARKAPELPAQKDESRMDRRARGTQEFAATFGRQPGESAEDYKARVMPMIKTGLLVPRTRAEEMRKTAEEKAHVSAEQSKQLDRAFDKVYDDVIAYTDKAIADRQLSPYERNVAGWLEYAGGLGTILSDAQGQVGRVLSSDQMQSMADAGFEWGEYLGLLAPWEKLQAPPPPR
jgi:hypothetical protein